MSVPAMINRRRISFSFEKRIVSQQPTNSCGGTFNHWNAILRRYTHTHRRQSPCCRCFLRPTSTEAPFLYWLTGLRRYREPLRCPVPRGRSAVESLTKSFVISVPLLKRL